MTGYCVILSGRLPGDKDDASVWAPVIAAFKMDEASFAQRVLAALPLIVRQHLDEAAADEIAQRLRVGSINACIQPEDEQLVHFERAGTIRGPLPRSALNVFIQPGERYRLRGSQKWESWAESKSKPDIEPPLPELFAGTSIDLLHEEIPPPLPPQDEPPPPPFLMTAAALPPAAVAQVHSVTEEAQPPQRPQNAPSPLPVAPIAQTPSSPTAPWVHSTTTPLVDLSPKDYARKHMPSAKRSHSGRWAVGLILVLIASGALAWIYLPHQKVLTNVMQWSGLGSDPSGNSQTATEVVNRSSDRESSLPDDDKTKDNVKRQVISNIAVDHNMDPSDIVQFDAQIETASGKSGAYHIAGSFAVESDRPSNIYEAANQVVRSNQCAVSPQSCSYQKIKHIVYFDAIATPQEKLDGSIGLSVSYKSTVDKTLAEKAREDAIRVQEAQRQQQQQAQEQVRLQQEQQQAQEQQQRNQLKEAQLQAIRAQQEQALALMKQQQQQQMEALRRRLELRSQEQFASDSAAQQQLQSEAQRSEQQQSQRRQLVRYAPPVVQRLQQKEQEGASSQLTDRMIKQRDQQAANQRAAREDERQQLQQLQQDQNEEQSQLLQQQAKELQEAKESNEPATAAAAIRQQFAPTTNPSVSANDVPAKATGMNNGGAGQVSNNPSFDCAKANNPTDTAICADSNLSRLDVTQAQLYRQAIEQTSPENAHILKDSQRRWLQSRTQLCGAERSCLEQQFNERIAVLKQQYNS